jgi:hypothetical protein
MGSGHGSEGAPLRGAASERPGGVRAGQWRRDAATSGAAEADRLAIERADGARASDPAWRLAAARGEYMVAALEVVLDPAAPTGLGVPLALLAIVDELRLLTDPPVEEPAAEPLERPRPPRATVFQPHTPGDGEVAKVGQALYLRPGMTFAELESVAVHNAERAAAALWRFGVEKGIAG